MVNRITSCGCSVPKGTKCIHERARVTARQKANDEQRGSSASRGYTKEWWRESHAFLKSLGSPLCACGCGQPANMVDHIIAPKGNMALFWDRTNWQPYNQLCNRRKNIKHEGGFGRKPISDEALSRARPKLSKSRIPVHIVCGAPGSGKSTFVERNAGPDDIRIDLDVIRAELAGTSIHQANATYTRQALDRRNEMLRGLATSNAPAAWFIVAAPTMEERRWWQQQLGGTIHLMNTDLDECKRRITADHRREGQHNRMIQLAEDWFAKANG
ncbi:ATP-binding protein [Ochrobactrum sp. CM-21-5]|nr:ATP-binding protein [Ochrobactrum sp. CM-21-5]MBC2884326.1 ATP-binding protein [Ochrobactrum sp. CM-21-5]